MKNKLLILNYISCTFHYKYSLLILCQFVFLYQISFIVDFIETSGLICYFQAVGYLNVGYRQYFVSVG